MGVETANCEYIVGIDVCMGHVVVVGSAVDDGFWCRGPQHSVDGN